MHQLMQFIFHKNVIKLIVEFISYIVKDKVICIYDLIWTWKIALILIVCSIY